MDQPYRQSQSPDDLMIEVETNDVYVTVYFKELYPNNGQKDSPLKFTFYGNPTVKKDFIGNRYDSEGKDEPTYALWLSNVLGSDSFYYWFNKIETKQCIDIPEHNMIYPWHMIARIEHKTIVRKEKVYYKNPDNWKTRF